MRKKLPVTPETHSKLSPGLSVYLVPNLGHIIFQTNKLLEFGPGKKVGRERDIFSVLEA